MTRSSDDSVNAEPVVGPPGISRRRVLAAAAGAATFTFLQRRAAARPISPAAFLDGAVLEQVAHRDPALRPPLLVDAQTHVWWRSGGLRSLTPSGEHFLKTIAGSPAKVLCKPVPKLDT